MSSLQIKKNYRCVPSLQQFYSGVPFAVSSDGSFIACSNGDAIKIVDSPNASIKASIEVDIDAGVTALALSPDDKFLFSAAGHSRLIRGHDGPVMAMACHASGGLLATAGADRKVLVWDVDGGFCTHYFKGHKDVVTTLMFHPDTNKTLLFSGSADATVVNLWDLHDHVFKMTTPTYEVLEGLCVVKSGTELASFLGSCNLQSGKRRDRSSSIYFITVGERGVVRMWDSERAVCLYEQKSSDVTVSSDTDDSPRGFTAAVILPLDQGLLCVTVDHQFLFYSLVVHLEEKFELMLCKRLVGYNEEILDMRVPVVYNAVNSKFYFEVLAPNVSQFALCRFKCISVRLWNSESINCIGVGMGHMGGVGAVAFSKKWKNFFVSGSSDRTIKVRSTDGISDDADQPINLKAKAVVAAHDKDINSLAIAPNDTLVCSGSQDRTACVWRLPDLVSVVVLKGHKRGIWSVEFSPVDQCVIIASGDKTIKMWAIANGSCLKTFEGHTSSVLRASFLTRGTQFVSCGADGLVKLWTVKTNECIATYDQHEDKLSKVEIWEDMNEKGTLVTYSMCLDLVWALAIGRKTEMFATGGGDAVVNLWYDSTASDKVEAFRKEEGWQQSDRDSSEFLARKKFIYLLSIFIRGIGELLEGLIPYSQRHFSRIDRLVRSTFLLDYTLHGMSVIEPDTNATEMNDADNKLLVEKGDQEQELTSEMLKEKAPSKKRKPNKSKDTSRKKVKGAAYTSLAPIPLKV
ncbi:hypothetical protein H0E87_030823 [Populus deltoides]|uniref:U3 small nucleolar RNA-associated protein 13 C-terminal domain-containing protein n=2 Tax=Populus deltoides TaxID=3696 RepID=A0A8T2WH89_POPDE|nr:hypothetical protein H0E87_030823 [Populus deltoides]